jgi:hypothetical protein
MDVDRKADTNFKDLMSIMSLEPAELGLSTTAQMQVPVEALVAYNQQKRDQAVYRNTLNLGALLVDPKEPSTTKRAFAILPELRKVPEERLIKMTKLAIMIESILRSGEITSRQEFMLIYQLLDPRATIPEKYPWTELVESAGQQNVGTNGRMNLYWAMNPFNFLKRGEYKPYNPGNGVNGDDDFEEPQSQEISGFKVTGSQLKLKFVILRRLFPALKNSGDADLIMVLKALYPGDGGTLQAYTANFNKIHLKGNTRKGSNANEPKFGTFSTKNDNAAWKVFDSW